MRLTGKQSLSINAFQFTAEQAGAEVKEAGQTEEEAFYHVVHPPRDERGEFVYTIAVDEGGRVRLHVLAS